MDPGLRFFCKNDNTKKTLLYAASGALAVIILILLGPSGCSEATPPWLPSGADVGREDVLLDW